MPVPTFLLFLVVVAENLAAAAGGAAASTFVEAFTADVVPEAEPATGLDGRVVVVGPGPWSPARKACATAALTADDGPYVAGKVFIRVSLPRGGIGTDREGRTFPRVSTYQGSWG
jgi:hypothetical protein